MKADAPVPRRFDSLQDFVALLERRARLTRIREPVSLVHEVTEIHRRVLAEGGPALLFERPVDAAGRIQPIPLLANLFGTRERIEWGFGLEAGDLPHLAAFLADLRDPRPPRSLRDAWQKLPHLKAALSMNPRTVRRAPCQATVWQGEDADLDRLPIQTCWPGEPAPLVSWPLVITQAPDDPADINVGIYRMQKLGKNRLILRWLAHRGGARHHRLWQAAGRDMPVAVVIGADPATILSAVMPLPDGMSELSFAGALSGRRQETACGLTVPLPIPASAEIVLEGTVSADETAEEGPYGDHTGYYNAVEPFPVMTLSAITLRKDPLYLSTYTGRPPDEPSRLGEAMNELFVPLVKRQFPEILDLWLPPEACSYRAMVVSIDKRYPGQARRVMMGLWSMLPQFSYTKLIIAVDGDIDVKSWPDVIWALSTRFDAGRDLMLVENTPIDYLDFASPKSGLGGKLGLDATRKIGTESEREWGRVLTMTPDIIARVDSLWASLGLSEPSA
ncbi:UbiD family decarboxylase [Shinella sp. 838]|jgi:4-hydroxy-3-polyprenylbenzoate decarboxylase|uniref:UbiD family decarboxylase n=1 Tax=unclassified Shinella TaxID=2643062 RepID=UPI000437B7AB|nr:MULTISPECIES: UbiD family decarboxylase [unclassified Shinella]EYR78622.1 3-octaprenyl-4-hydroxybenzoate carboxy-lyase UbiD [Shinella sp. DD12]MCA0344722.1 UbiD family decarboxylase [Pseudomonadota bacterium]MDG4669511.1 UbiD family decarboxylase [Shinella sp. 838]